MANEQKQAVPAQIFLQTGGEPAQEESGSGLDLSMLFDYLDMIRSRLWLFLAIPIIFLVASFIRVYTATPIYQSTCQLQIQPRPLNISGMQGLDPVAGGYGYFQFAQAINTEIELMRTPDVLNQAFEEMNLAEDSEFATGSPIGTLAGNLRISSNEDNFLINVAFRSTDPEKAARTANFLGELYVRLYQERKRKVSGGGISRLRDQLDNIATARDDALRKLTEFKKEHGLMDLDYERELISERIGALTESLIAAEMEERQVRDAAETIEAWKNQGQLGAVVQIVDNAFAKTFRMEQLRMQLDLPELLTRFGRGHAEVKGHEKKIEDLEGAVESEIETSLVMLRLKEKSARERRQVVADAISELEKELMDLDSFGTEYFRLKATYEAAETAYRKVVARINDVDISFNTGEIESNDFLRVVRRATPNYSPVYPRRRSALTKAGALGLVLGAGLCIFLGMLDTSVKSKEEIQKCFKDEVILGTVPGRKEDVGELAAMQDSQSVQSEAFRNLRTSLSLCLTARDEKCFAVTSCGPGEGKTTVAMNLAAALARNNRKVLLLELDMRRPRLKDVFELKDEEKTCGLSQVLVGQAELKDVLRPFPDFDGMHYALCGPIPPNPSELLGTERFDEVLDEAKSLAEYVIIDCPPLLNVADTSLIAGRGVPLLHVVRLLRTTRHELRHAAEKILTIQAKCAGIVINQVEVPNLSRYAYYRYRRYGHYYGSKYGDRYGYGNYGYGRGDEKAES